MICRGRISVKLLQLTVITSYKCSINLIPNPNQVSSNCDNKLTVLWNCTIKEQISVTRFLVEMTAKYEVRASPTSTVYRGTSPMWPTLFSDGWKIVTRKRFPRRVKVGVFLVQKQLKYPPKTASRNRWTNVMNFRRSIGITLKNSAVSLHITCIFNRRIKLNLFDS